VQTKKSWRFDHALLAAVVLAVASPACGQPANSGSPPSQLSPLTVRDLNNQPVATPCLADGKRVTMIIYADPDHYRQNEYFVHRIKQYVFPLDEFCGYGIVNLSDTYLPTFVLRLILKTIRSRSEAERKAVILTDPDHTVARGWQLGDCNNQVVVLLLDGDGRLLFWKKGAMDARETDHFIGLITSRISHYRLRSQ
jgi:hypothetical protein